MNIFKKRDTVAQNIAFIALASAVNVVFVILTTLVPLLFFLLVFILPLTSTLVWILCNKKYFLVYAITSVSLCLIVNVFQISDTIFYVIPSILSGFIFGVLIEKKIPSFWIILSATFVQMGITYASLPLIKLLVEIDTIDQFIKVFGLSEFQYSHFLPPIFIFVLSIIQTAITFLVVSNELEKIGIELNQKDVNHLVLEIIQICLIGLTIGFAFIYGPISYLLFGLVIYFGTYMIFLCLQTKKKLPLILTFVNFFIQIFIYALMSSIIDKPYQLLIFLDFFFIECIIDFSNYYLEKRLNKTTIKEQEE